MTIFAEYFDFSSKFKRKSGDGLDEGSFPFFVSSQENIKRTNEPDYTGEALVFGTGGNASVHYVNGSFSTSGDCLVAKPKQPNLAKAVYYYLKGNIHLLEEGFKGAGLKHISKKYISSLSVPNFSELDTHKIVCSLDKADAIRRKRAESLKLLDELLRATFLDMFGDPSCNPKNHPIIEVKHLLSNERAGTQSGPFGSSLKKHEYVSDGIPVWGIDNVSINKFTDEPYLFISQDKYKQLQRYSVINGDILISRAGTVGRMCIADTKYETSIISTNLVRVALNKEKMLPEYFVGLFSYFADRVGSLRVNQKENAFSFLNPTILRGLPIPVPPIAAQIAYSNIVRARKAIIHKNNIAGMESDTLFHSLVARAFKGELTGTDASKKSSAA